jgi:hypothetical protein
MTDHKVSSQLRTILTVAITKSVVLQLSRKTTSLWVVILPTVWCLELRYHIRPTWWDVALLIRDTIRCLTTARSNNKVKITRVSTIPTWRIKMPLWASVEVWSGWKVIVQRYLAKIPIGPEPSSNSEGSKTTMAWVELDQLEQLALEVFNHLNMVWELFKVKKELIDLRPTISWCLNRSWDLLTWVRLLEIKALLTLKF